MSKNNFEDFSKGELIGEISKLKSQLDEAEKRYRQFADNVSDVIWIFDLDKEKFTYISPSIQNLLGYTSEKALDMNWGDSILPEEKHKLKQTIAMILSDIKNQEIKPDAPYKDIIGYYHKNGAIVWTEVSARFILNESGNPHLLLGVTRDVTERKIAEDNLRKTHIKLEEMVEERTAHLHETNIALKVLLEKREKDKSEIEEKVALNIKNLILPTLEKLKMICQKKQQQAYLGILESNLDEINSSILRNLSLKYLSLSPKETLIATLITHGITNKEISELLNLSQHTIEFHRRNIRNKLDIKNKKVNLRTFLISLR